MKKTILFVINTLGCAGAETALVDLLGCLDPEQYDVSLYVMLGQGVLWNRIPAHVRILNRNPIHEEVLSGPGRRALAKTTLRAALRRGTGLRLLPELIRNRNRMKAKGGVKTEKLLWRVISDGAERFSERYDLAVAFLEGASTYYVADHVNARSKAAFVHVDYGRAGYTPELDHGCYDRFKRIFTVSDEVREHFLEMYPQYASVTEVFHNVVDTGKILRRAEEPGGFRDDYDGVRILTVGRLTEQKSYPTAIDAMRLLKNEGRPVRWYVLGEGDQRKALERQIARLGLTEDFVLLGAAENPYPYYRQTDLYVHATGFEGKSIAIQEAQTLGCVIMASACSGNMEQITDGVDGTLCPLTPEGIRDGIVYLLEHREKWDEFRRGAREKNTNYLEDLKKLEELSD